ncbi:MAG: aminotransferase class I/II-fold pyridoxal phosphate-dependent enzyme [Ignavibacteriota bacterium]
MKLEPFEMERMQSTWENLVEMDMSESGVRPVSLRELAEMGLDIDAILSMPLGYSQSNGTIALRENLAAIYPGATPDHIEVTNGTSEANYLLALALLRQGDEVALQVPNYMQYGGVPQSCGAQVRPFRLQIYRDWEPDWDEFNDAVNEKTRLVYLSNPNNPTGSVLSPESMRRIVDRLRGRRRLPAGRRSVPRRRDSLPANAQLLGHERSRDRHQRALQGVWHSGSAHRLDRRPARSGGADVEPARLHHHRAQQDLQMRWPAWRCRRRIAKSSTREPEPSCSKTCPSCASGSRALADSSPFANREPGALCLVRYASATPSYPLCERIRENRSVLVVPGVHLGAGRILTPVAGREAGIPQRRIAARGPGIR